MTRSKAYPKGVAKRDEILHTALDVIARNGYSRTSVRQLAEAVGLTNAGLLHYFESKEHLFAEILRMRDEVDAEAQRSPGTSSLDALVSTARHNAKVPGLVQLYSRLAAEAEDPAHGAHEYFRDRYANLRTSVAASIRQEQEAGAIRRDADPERLARLIIAMADGLQTQWLIDPSFDMAAEISYLISLAAVLPDEQ